MSETADTIHPDRTKDWVNIFFLTLTPVIGIAGTALYTWRVGFEPWMAILLMGMYFLVGLSICAGYHRFFSHRSYDCSPLVQFFYACFGAMAAQNSILWWSSSHRVHHKYVDKDWDPYNIKRGFWWAHIFWIFYKNPDSPTWDNARDLAANPVVMWQHRWHTWILVLGGFGIPTLIGAMFGDPIAGLLWGGFLRLVVVHHTTFFVNSLAHYLGERTYNPDESARDNWFVALMTLGEGYHSFHHRFPADFRNGIKWYHWDPAKWLIATLRALGLARRLRVTSTPLIEHARLRAAELKLEQHKPLLPASVRHEIEVRIERAKDRIESAMVLWRKYVEGRVFHAKRRRATILISRRRVREARRDWKIAIRILEKSLKAA